MPYKDKEYAKLRRRELHLKNPEKRKAYLSRYRAKNKLKQSFLNKKWRLENAEYYRNKKKAWEQANLPLRNSYSSARRAKIIHATPKWLTPDQKLLIYMIFVQAKEITQMTGIKHEVDHIIPLRGKEVCGLHVPWNLQILPAIANRIKANKCA